jgi:hypothetical protein
MKVLACLLVIVSGFSLMACSKNSKAESNEQVVIDDVYKAKPGGEIVLDDRSFEQNSGGTQPSSQQTTRNARDGSEITTMFDGHGNKTEMRVFNSDPLLQSIMVRTSAKGERQVSVYGQNGRVRQLPDNMLDKAMSAQARELANAAGIYEGRKEVSTPTVVQNNQPPLQPLPSSNFPVQTPQPQIVPAATPAPAVVETPKPAPVNTIVPKQNSEKQPPKSQPIP